ncbi:bifunctional 4-hydroxy-2-oxoglutarate aldolase/2-dehydro-3-deoxy-phosphogluconate aldolase [Sutcliffiella rhizosphaerae]|uniref:2-dehydro-3-deoxy-6-phosphogalactonate aldolase n=1 Tax=Sutcliffiella rhizosphaerae TaxID=2880967 RepID=A0ABM8YLU2_9BACI|nr:bifunctional 4-hydroxy-2-oxoglutarate aldolase/2-dehydro-3-deoxy-phosphogluconate aldolase [Sutcliffiella rhizosphaerae]CAG9620936.1 2-dehydro-3-deoxy-6-phosphogalactonate aldolase [Sutcliffiella rhizosphaerae]
MSLLKEIKEVGVVAVIRGATEDNILKIASSLSAGGVKALEITVETPKVLTLMEKVASEMGDEVIVGAGTVLDPETARAAIMAGSKFIFSPTVNTETIKMTKRYGAVSIPGAMTPTEILTAYEHGADMIKVFPANVVGAGYFKDVRGPLPHIPLMATGGISIDNVAEYISAGAVAVGAGSTLINTKVEFTEEHCRHVTETAARFVSRVKQARGGLLEKI